MSAMGGKRTIAPLVILKASDSEQSLQPMVLSHLSVVAA